MSITVAVLGGAAVGAVLAAVAARNPGGPAKSKPGKSEEAKPEPALLPPGVVPPKPAGAPFAEGLARPVWPVRTRHPRAREVSYRGVDGKVRGKWARRFAAPRASASGDRNHAGIDVFANAGDQVLAMANGVVAAVQSFHLGSWAIFVDHGPVTVMYGEIDKGSWGRLGLDVGSRVAAGQPIAEVACMVRNDAGDCTSHMLHLEAYAPGTTKNERWLVGKPAPEPLRDPSLLLLLAAQEASTPPVVA